MRWNGAGKHTANADIDLELALARLCCAYGAARAGYSVPKMLGCRMLVSPVLSVLCL